MLVGFFQREVILWRHMCIISFLEVLLVENILGLLMFPKMVADVDDYYSILLMVSCVSLFFFFLFSNNLIGKEITI